MLAELLEAARLSVDWRTFKDTRSERHGVVDAFLSNGQRDHGPQKQLLQIILDAIGGTSGNSNTLQFNTDINALQSSREPSMWMDSDTTLQAEDSSSRTDRIGRLTAVAALLECAIGNKAQYRIYDDYIGRKVQEKNYPAAAAALWTEVEFDAEFKKYCPDDNKQKGR